MTRSRPNELERLRKAFTSIEGGTEPGEPALESHRIWRVVRGELPPHEVEEMVDRAARSPQVAAEWRLAAELSHQLDGVNTTVAVPIGRRNFVRWAVSLAAAAAIIVGVGLPLYRSLGPGTAPTLRAAEEAELKSALPASQVLPRSAFELSWTSAGAGSLYDIVVTDANLEIIDRASFLEQPSHVVREESLAHLPAGAEVWWKVDATRTDGRRISSATFVNRVQ